MKSVEVQFNEVLGKLTRKQQSHFESKLAKSKRDGGKLPSIEVQLNIAESVLNTSETIVTNNGPVDLVAPEITEAQASQMKFYQNIGLTEAESKVAVGLRDKDLKSIHERLKRGGSSKSGALLDLILHESSRK